MSDITNKERLLKVFSGEETDRIPLTLYTGLFPRGFVERELRNDGVGLFCIPSPALTMKNPKVNKKILEIYENEVFFIKNIFSTPIGEVSETYRTGGGYNTKLLCEFLIKDKKDYEVAEFVLENEKYEFDFELNKEREENIGEDGIVVPMLPKTPLQDMMYNLMGPERFSIELHENSKDFLHLYDVLFQRYKKMCEILSDASVGFVEIGDNITSDMIGKDRFRKYIMPVYEFVCEMFHKKGKKVGVHMDGNLNILKEDISECKFDFIDAFTPCPDFDLSLKEAKKIWKDKIIIINFPSSVHMRTKEEIRKFTINLIEEAFPCDKFIVSITENIPQCAWQNSLKTINNVLKEYGEVPK